MGVGEEAYSEVLRRLEEHEQRQGRFEKKLEENTKMTQEVLDTLRAFKIIGTIAKWCTVVGGAVVGAYHAAQQFFKHLG